jgi:hypothetical protein
LLRTGRGAAGNLATEAVVRAPPDGYTLLLVNGANAVSATLYEKLSFDFIRDIAPGRQHWRRRHCHGDQSIIPGKNRSRVHRLCQSQSG